MKPEDKELLIRDLCARLPYGVKFKHKDWDVPLELTRIYKSVKYGTFIINERIFEDDFDTLKPYLRPMSSMTEEERKQLSEYIFSEKGRRYFTIQSNGILYSGIDNLCFIGLGDDTIDRLIDWLNAHHFDYRNLIERGLALEAPKDMYK